MKTILEISQHGDVLYTMSDGIHELAAAWLNDGRRRTMKRFCEIASMAGIEDKDLRAEPITRPDPPPTT